MFPRDERNCRGGDNSLENDFQIVCIVNIEKLLAHLISL